MSSMKAVRIHSYGGVDALVVEDVPYREPGEGEVLIRNYATSVNPFDCAVRAGYLASYFNYTLPITLGTDIAGEVADVGPGVENFKPGDKVYARGGVTQDGAYAEYVVVPASDVAFRPESLTDIQAAALPHVSLTAWQALFELGELKPGQTVLIQGAGGGVGHVAVQLAKWRGAKVVGTASQSADFVRGLGADEVVDYTATPFEEIVREVDLVLDTVGGEVQARSCLCLKPGGILVSVIHAAPEELTATYGIRSALVYSVPPIGKTLTELAGLVDAGFVKPHVFQVLPLSEVRTAHQIVEGKHVRGKLVLETGA